MAERVRQLFCLGVLNEDGSYTVIAEGKDSLSARDMVRDRKFVDKHPEVLGKHTRVVILRDEPFLIPKMSHAVCPECKRPFEDSVFEVVESNEVPKSEPKKNPQTSPAKGTPKVLVPLVEEVLPAYTETQSAFVGATAAVQTLHDAGGPPDPTQPDVPQDSTSVPPPPMEFNDVEYPE